ncbi:MAG: hypothetical protein ACRDQA_05685 [Nocardioidaceae bacterium]
MSHLRLVQLAPAQGPVQVAVPGLTTRDRARLVGAGGRTAVAQARVVQGRVVRGQAAGRRMAVAEEVAQEVAQEVAEGEGHQGHRGSAS